MARRRPLARRSPAAPVLEPLEGRALFSVAGVMHPQAIYLRTAAAAAAKPSTDVEGYTPAQIRAAYGFDAVAGDGSGQTIAIVDAYNDPNVAADLAVFDAQFGLAAPPSLKVVGQTGSSSTLPKTNADWAGEIALDVEWAHAMAPGAGLLLVETKSDDTDDLLAGVDYARAAAGVSVVSLSWGGSESVSWADGGDDPTAGDASDDDTHFATPAGHRGVTFVAAAGDSGAKGGVLWPAAAPNVLSVGGTTLTLSDDGSGGGSAVASETGWSGTSGGYSKVELEPAYQKAVQSTGKRSGPDVAYAGDPDQGFAVYDSVPDAGYDGWQEVGGTSAGTPQWAALLAVADQSRTAAGNATLYGYSQTLPALYGLYSAYGTAGYAAYTTAFTDVTTGGGSTVHYRNGRSGGNATAATVGYDTVTGLGSPHAAAVVAALAAAAGASADPGTGGGTGTGTGSGDPSNASPTDLTGTFLTTPPAEAVAGSSDLARVQLTNAGTAKFTGPVTLTLLGSTDAAASADDATLATVTVKKLTLPVGGKRTLTLKFAYPAGVTATTSYTLLATVAATATQTTTTTTAAAAMPVAVEPATADLSVAFAGTAAVAVAPGKKGVAVVRLTNLGNVTAAGTVGLTLYAAPAVVGGAATDVTRTVLATLPARGLKLAAGKSVTLRVAFTAPADLTPGDDALTAVLHPATTPADADAADDTATAATA